MGAINKTLTATSTPYADGQRVYATTNVLFRGEITTTVNAGTVGRYLQFGITNVGGTAANSKTARLHYLRLQGNQAIAVYIDGKKESAAGVLQSVAVPLPITVADNTTYVVEIETTRYSSVLYFYPENQSRAQGVRHALVMDDWRGPAGTLSRRLRITAQGGTSFVANETYVDNLSETLLTPQRTLTAQTTKRGYTLHEHLDNSGLVHITARLYDPLMARFLSPDPVLAYPEN
ncbi:MAG: hypothetical protein Q8J78_05020, partial [Moraxellaceae bacterium]|nr:hypothetical protein [Moraxellaceae bacterium]